jgi:hypothetical protein
MSFISLCHTAETVEVPLRSSSNPFPNIYYPYGLFSSEDWEVENFGHVASKLIEAWIEASSCAAAAGPRIQDCRETQDAPAQDQYAINALKFPPYPRGTKAVQFRTAKSLISGCTEGHSLPVSEIWDS